MTERFVGNFQGTMLVSVKDTERDCNVNILQIVEIANELAEENEILKQRNKNLKKRLKALEDANDGLIQTIGYFDMENES